MKVLRAELREAVRGLICGTDELLHAVYMASADEACDAENVLFYNVGAGCFAHQSRVAMRFERVFSEPPPPPRPLSASALHYQSYRSATRRDEFLGWKRRQRLAAWTVACEPLRPLPSASSIWLHMKSGACETSAGRNEKPSWFGMSVTISLPRRTVLNLAEVIKPVFDGIVAALHSHDGTMLEEVSHRLGEKLGVEAKQIAQELLDESRAVLGKRKLVHPWRDVVQWNPADDRVVAGELTIRNNSDAELWGLSGELYEVESKPIVKL